MDFTRLASNKQYSRLPMRDLISEGYVAPLPAIARERIKERYICTIGPLGYDCPGMNRLREIISDLDKQQRFRNALFLVASHTHWDEELIIESYDPEKADYVVGPRKDKQKVAPFSFVFTNNGPQAFEWFDGSIPIDYAEIEEAYRFVDELNDVVVAELSDELPIPIGVSIDHRFKRSIFDARMYSFVEGDSDEFDGKAIVRPVFESVLRPSPNVPGTIRVAWSCYLAGDRSEKPFSTSEAAFYQTLEDKITTLTPFDAQEFLDRLERRISSDGPLPISDSCPVS